MGTVIADILPYAIAIAISPLRIAAVILMLFSKNARRTSLGFLTGWLLGVTVVVTIVVLVANPAIQSTGAEESLLPAVLHILLGLLLLFAAYREWKKRPQLGEEVEIPKWMSLIESLTAGKALGLGVLLSGVSPKNLAFILAAGIAIAAAGLDTTQTVVSMIVFILLASVSVAAPVILYMVMGDKATPILNDWKVWLIHNNNTVLMVLFIVFGFVILGKGIGALIGG